MLRSSFSEGSGSGFSLKTRIWITGSNIPLKASSVKIWFDIFLVYFVNFHFIRNTFLFIVLPILVSIYHSCSSNFVSLVLSFSYFVPFSLSILLQCSFVNISLLCFTTDFLLVAQAFMADTSIALHLWEYESFNHSTN